MKIPLPLLLPFVAILSSLATTAAERPEKPNVVLILTDDLGWQDVGCYDIDDPSPYETPNIDAFAKTGVQFWQGYSPAPTCAPSRCAILSGVHPARAQKTHVVGGAPPHPLNKHMAMMDPWYSGRMPEDTLTLAKILSKNGYITGHSGKWHIAIDHHAFPQPLDVGFDFTRSTRGARSGMADRLAGFATTQEDDPYRLDENGFPYHQTNEDALVFMREHKDEPFFLYYATWLVHAPIQTRSERLLKKYVEKLKVDPKNTNGREIPGQLNPFYAAMVEEIDYYIGMIFDYLTETEDPRWPGHKLNENTYVIFTSDNGGMEGSGKERYTDNEPLARGKISAMEGGTRVPFLIAGPGIPEGAQSNVMINGLDLYPTILSMTGTEKPDNKILDGNDLLPLLHGDVTDPNLVTTEDGSPREFLMWHFPHGHELESTIRNSQYKLVRNYNHLNDPNSPRLELFQLYESSSNGPMRVDIEERINIAETKPEIAAALDQELSAMLEEMEASYPSYNPNSSAEIPGREKVPNVLSHKIDGSQATFTIQENGARVAKANLIYTLNGGERYEEWFRKPATLQPNQTVIAELPAGTTHCYLNLIDENRFLRSYPEVGKRQNNSFTVSALAIGAAEKTNKTANKKPDYNVPFDRWDVDKDDHLSREEYKTGQAGGKKLDERFDRFDKNQDGRVSRLEFVNR